MEDRRPWRHNERRACGRRGSQQWRSISNCYMQRIENATEGASTILVLKCLVYVALLRFSVLVRQVHQELKSPSRNGTLVLHEDSFRASPTQSTGLTYLVHINVFVSAVLCDCVHIDSGFVAAWPELVGTSKT